MLGAITQGEPNVNLFRRNCRRPFDLYGWDDLRPDKGINHQPGNLPAPCYIGPIVYLLTLHAFLLKDVEFPPVQPYRALPDHVRAVVSRVVSPLHQRNPASIPAVSLSDHN